ncbi:MAG: hypothetical protein IE936_00220, partial [Moraxella osloensis]|nr:hypothetical protein [Moraxella osloensis]
SSQSALAYHCGNDNIHVFASDSKFGREDDKWIDYQALDGQDFTILVVRERDLSKVSPFFNRVQIKPVQIDKETLYYLVTGQGFQYELYREKLLQPVYQQYYKAPDWLEALTIGCGFKERYDF